MKWKNKQQAIQFLKTLDRTFHQYIHILSANDCAKNNEWNEETLKYILNEIHSMYKKSKLKK